MTDADKLVKAGDKWIDDAQAAARAAIKHGGTGQWRGDFAQPDGSAVVVTFNKGDKKPTVKAVSPDAYDTVVVEGVN